ncbi:MAG TPA: VOC family protein [Sphingomicrobium sp.]|nr:VOC family protein [Sphingomicrobium sp.]
MTAPFKPLGLDHLLLHVRGMDEAERFYCEVLGCTVKNRMDRHAMTELSAGIVLVDTADANGLWALEGTAPGRNLDHFAILTDGWNDAEVRAWLVHNGVPIEEERSEEGEVSLYVRDPSGNLVELISREGRPRAP